ncbi:MAG TPA: Mut7-C RNAse domain-containing protein [Deltaproteobacteria bacterium]|nr:Mut7-C RNAse domain-containing protein [Deltaproteobacteria bacterium]
MYGMPSGPKGRFLCDPNLGKLARWLRILGFDAEYMRHESEDVVRRAIESGRIVLTRRRTMAARPSVVVIVQDRVADQLMELGRVCDLSSGDPAFTRCSLCNTPLQAAGREEVKGLVPDYVHATRETFARCPSCRRIYWKGTHYQRACDRMKSILKGCRP